ncbi:DUF4249 domain-containing protein [Flavobacterium sp. YJ01]|uniref:DUF4249 domain-containing protein n=1 Tax=unclassified Flavobacterium TaxID=196869 RepID=UPI0023E37210|nr:DUF4249 domain-containing protein [Flavobacterium sp. YJ01]WET04768.1 DUF4249 domain-containing protein [Flavobacterium sp. YJ01]
MYHKAINIKHSSKIILLLLLSLLINSCTEAYNLQTNTYEEAIVIEATLTNELKKQEIKITKTARFEDEGPTTETGATVIVKDNLNNEYAFTEQSGVYVSQSEFEVISGRQYRLEIKTKDGKVYESSSETLTTATPIADIIPTAVTKEKEGLGVQINVNSYDPTGTSKYYRYEYEETYKIVAPKWSSERAVVTGPQRITVEEDNDPNKKVCYATKKSTDIIITNTNNLAEDRVNFPVRFIREDDYIIAQRYSILVKQYVENQEAYTFHKILREMSTSSSALSPKQPGVISGNIRCTSNVDVKVIGYFDVATVSSKRIFFNYTDLFPPTNTPAYLNPCENVSFRFCFQSNANPPCDGPLLISAIQNNALTYVAGAGSATYTMVDAACGDCTTFASNIIPSFWKD